MESQHPSEIELLELVEGELDAEAESTVRAHLVSCDACASDVERLERARGVLRASPIVELPPGRLEELLERLPAQEREAGELRGLVRSRRRLLAVLAPAAAALVAVVAVVSTTGGGEGPAEEAAPLQATADAGAAEAQAEAAPAQGGEESLDQAARAPAAMVEGPPREVVRALREAGFEARQVGRTVEVTGAAPEEVARALEGRRDGPVAVFALP
jgi:hypothetical protein